MNQSHLDCCFLKSFNYHQKLLYCWTHSLLIFHCRLKKTLHDKVYLQNNWTQGRHYENYHPLVQQTSNFAIYCYLLTSFYLKSSSSTGKSGRYHSSYPSKHFLIQSSKKNPQETGVKFDLS